MQKCSSIKHKEIDAVYFCQECRLYICNKCEKYHLELFDNDHQINLEKNKNIIEVFTGFCKQKNHFIELKYFCKTHNKLCCAECITKVKTKYSGLHTDCDLCSIEDIEKDKKNKLKEKIKTLEELSINLQQIINELKPILKKIDKNKEELKINIQKIFIKIKKCFK